MSSEIDQSQQSEDIKLNISAAVTVKVTGLILLIILSWQFISSIVSLIMLIAIAIFFAISLNPLIIVLTKTFRIKNHKLATILSLIVVLLGLSFCFIITVPPLIAHISQFASDLPQTIEAFKDQDNAIARFVADNQLDVHLTNIVNNASSHIGDNLGGLVNIFRSTISLLVSIILVVVIAFMVLVEAPSMIDKLKMVTPKETFNKWRHLSLQMNEVIVGYVTGQLTIALIAGLFATLFLLILDVPNAIAMGTIVALSALIPLIGATLGAIIAIALTFLTDIDAALILIIYFVIYQQIENVTIQPWIQGQQTNLSTLQVLITALIGGTMAGLVGAILAIPIAGCLKILIVHYLDNRAASSSV